MRYFDPSVRLTAYGLLALIAGFRPQRWANSVWLLYGAAALTIGLVNAVTINSLGSADPRYAGLAQQVRAYGVSGTVATNSFHILDLDADIPSVPVTTYAGAGRYHWFLWVTLPGFDPGAGTVAAMSHPGQEW